MKNLDEAYLQIELYIDELENRLLDLDPATLETIDDFNSSIFDPDFKRADYQLMKSIINEFDEETAIALLDLIRQKASETIIRILSSLR